MRIISDFHDYYDNVQQHGQDQSIIFKRNTSCYKLESKKILQNPNNDPCISFVNNIPEIITDSLIIERYAWYFSALDPIYIWVAGKLYFGISQIPNSNVTEQQFVFYNKIDVLDYIANSKESDKAKKRYIKNIITFYANAERNKESLNKKINELAIANNVSSCVIYQSSYARNINVIINPILKNYSFYKVVDPYTIYQDLDMWISGVLPSTKPIIEIDDKAKVKKHGFDPEYGFRNRGQK